MDDEGHSKRRQRKQNQGDGEGRRRRPRKTGSEKSGPKKPRAPREGRKRRQKEEEEPMVMFEEEPEKPIRSRKEKLEEEPMVVFEEEPEKPVKSRREKREDEPMVVFEEEPEKPIRRKYDEEIPETKAKVVKEKPKKAKKPVVPVAPMIIVDTPELEPSTHYTEPTSAKKDYDSGTGVVPQKAMGEDMDRWSNKHDYNERKRSATTPSDGKPRVVGTIKAELVQPVRSRKEEEVDDEGAQLALRKVNASQLVGIPDWTQCYLSARIEKDDPKLRLSSMGLGMLETGLFRTLPAGSIHPRLAEPPSYFEDNATAKVARLQRRLELVGLPEGPGLEQPAKAPRIRIGAPPDYPFCYDPVFAKWQDVGPKRAKIITAEEARREAEAEKRKSRRKDARQKLQAVKGGPERGPSRAHAVPTALARKGFTGNTTVKREEVLTPEEEKEKEEEEKAKYEVVDYPRVARVPWNPKGLADEPRIKNLSLPEAGSLNLGFQDLGLRMFFARPKYVSKYTLQYFDSDCTAYQRPHLIRVMKNALKACRCLALNDNELETVADLPFPPILTELHLERNHIKSFQDIPKQKNLQILNLSGNAITSMSGLTKERFPSLSRLVLRGNPIAGEPDYLRKVAEQCVSSNLAIESLDEKLFGDVVIEVKAQRAAAAAAEEDKEPSSCVVM